MIKTVCRFGIIFGLPAFILAHAAAAAPECVIDSNTKDSTSLIAVVSGRVTGFDPGPVYITLENGGLQFTTLVSREGKWALMYPSSAGDTSVLCWQGWTREKTEVIGRTAKR